MIRIVWILPDLGLASGGGTQGSGLKIPGLNLVFVVSMIVNFLSKSLCFICVCFDSIFFSGIYLVAVPALEFSSSLLVKCFHMSFKSCACCKGLLANVALKHYIYWMRLRPAGCLELKMLIYTSSVRRRMLTLLDVWVTMVAITSSVEWLYDVKWRETGLNAFPCLMSVKWALNLSLNVLPVWPTYWRPHFLQLKTLFVLQFKRPWIGIDCFVVQTVMGWILFLAVVC